MKKATLISISILGILLIFVSSSHAQNVFKTTPTSVIPFYEYVPQDYNSNSDKYPVVIFLHGVGERGPNTTDIATLKANIYLVAKHGPPKHVKAGLHFPFILLSPQLKNNYSGWTPAYILEVLNYAKTYLRIDERRIHITGLSMGGHGTWTMGENYASMFATLAPVCGANNSPTKACNIANENLPVWAFHGDADVTISITKSQRMVDAINACVPTPNPKAKLSVYAGVKHDAWNRAYQPDHTYHNPNYYEWLMTYTNKVNNGNTIPVANAGTDKTISLGSSLTLSGSGTDADGSITGYKWSLISGPSLSSFSNPVTASATITNLPLGTYIFRLQVTDNGGQTDSDFVKVTVQSSVTNVAPVANAGADKVLALPIASTTISGSATDLDGTIASYSWSKISGGTATLAGSTSATLSLSGLEAGPYVFRLTVKDNSGATHSDDMTLTVNNAPSANAGADKVISLPTTSTTVTGSATDSDGTVASYTWTKVSGGAATLTNTTLSTLSLAGLSTGTYVFRLTVKDNLGTMDSDDMTLIVNNRPVANAGPDKTITLPTNSISITGTGTDSDGTITLYQWSKLSGGAVNLSGTSTPTLTASDMAGGSYVFRLKVTDNHGGTHYDDAKIVVNVAPSVSAGPDIDLVVPVTSTSIQGTASDADGTISAWSWSKVSGNAATLSGTSSPLLNVSGLTEGAYVFRLSVKDNSGSTQTDDVTVRVINPTDNKTPNETPVANAGGDKLVTLPTNSLSISGSASDADGTISTYSWTKFSGGTATLTGASTSTLSLSNLVAGAYVFRLTVTDNVGASHYDDVTVIVNTAPVANAGPDMNVTLPATSITIMGSATDSDGTISSYAWSKVSGGTATLTGTSTSTLSVSSLVSGSYTFRLTVTDNKGATDTDDVIVTVGSNAAPSALAGPDLEITLPTNSIIINGRGEDQDGTIVTYIWSQLSGPTATMTNTDKPTVTITNLVSGTYVFRLRVVDNGGASDSNDMVLTVNSESTNQAPTASAGADHVITLPTSSVMIAGSGADTDGVVSEYSWTKVSGAAATLSGITSSTLNVSGLAAGVYVFRLTVKDNSGATGTDDVKVIVNVRPVSNAGPDEVVTLPKNVISIGGSGSDVDGTISSYSWSKVSGGAVTMLNTTSPTLSLEDLVAGTYVFRLTVKDNHGASHSDNMSLVVNIAPVVSAGADQTLTLPDNTITLYGSASDEDGSIRGYSWVKVSGGSAVMSGNLTPTVTITELQEGIYVFKLNAKDNSGSSRYDEVTVTVRSGASLARAAVNETSVKETIAGDDDTSIIGIFSQPEKAFWINKHVVLYDDQGNRIHDGVWNASASDELFRRNGFFIYHILEKGITLRRGKIYLVE